MISMGPSYAELKRRHQEALGELHRIQAELSARFADREAQETWDHVGQILAELPPSAGPGPALTIQINRLLARWFQQRLEETGDDAETFLNGLVLQDYLTKHCLV